jgi:hypothetical protein
VGSGDVATVPRAAFADRDGTEPERERDAVVLNAARDWMPASAWLSLGLLLPLAEAAIGVGLLFPRTRGVAWVGAVLMHALVLLSIGPVGRSYNAIVWPWNAAMIAPVCWQATFSAPAQKNGGPPSPHSSRTKRTDPIVGGRVDPVRARAVSTRRARRTLARARDRRLFP